MSRPERELHFRSGMCEDSILYVPYGEINKQWYQLNEYCDQLEKEVKSCKDKYNNASTCSSDIWGNLVATNSALNVACKALAKYEIIVERGTTLFCANNVEAYYNFLMKGDENE